MAGGGVRTADAVPELLKLIDNLDIPVVSAYNGHDLFGKIIKIISVDAAHKETEEAT